MAGLAAAVTTRIKLFATCPTLAIPPAIAARMCSTIDSKAEGISPPLPRRSSRR